MAPFLLISAALAFGRPQGVPSVLERRGGDAPEVVVARYEDLTAVIRSLPGVTDEARARLDALEREEPGARPPLWESLVLSSDIDDDPRVIDAARLVWEALGPNAYRVQFAPRRRTWRGYAEGRGWAALCGLGLVVVGVLATEASRRWGWWWLVTIPAFVAWPGFVYVAFRRRYRSLEAQGGRELPRVGP